MEQQDIHYVKQTLRRGIEQTEQEINLKMSFEFVQIRQSWDDEQEMPVRTIQEAELYDVSIITTPAYSGTEIGLRSLEHHRKQNRKSQAPRRVRMKSRLQR